MAITHIKWVQRGFPGAALTLVASEDGGTTWFDVPIETFDTEAPSVDQGAPLVTEEPPK